MEIEQNKKIDLKNLSEDARRILFLLVAVPGGKNVAMLREALGLGDAYRQGLVNVLTIQLCKELVAARLVKFDKENYGNNSKGCADCRTRCQCRFCRNSLRRARERTGGRTAG